MSMNIHIERNWTNGVDDIWIARDGITGGREVLRLLGDGVLRWDVLEPPVKVEPTLSLPRQLAELLGAELTGIAPPSAAQAAHLADAIAVRDRLLALVEAA